MKKSWQVSEKWPGLVSFSGDKYVYMSLFVFVLVLVKKDDRKH